MAETFNYDNKLAGDYPLVTESMVIASGEGELERGSILGRVTANSKGRLINSTNGDGSENFYAVLAEDVDATAADATAIVYLSGEFNENLLIVGDSTVAARKDAMRALNCYQKKTFTTDGEYSS